jgi:hypothetical protein
MTRHVTCLRLPGVVAAQRRVSLPVCNGTRSVVLASKAVVGGALRRPGGPDLPTRRACRRATVSFTTEVDRVLPGPVVGFAFRHVPPDLEALDG